MIQQCGNCRYCRQRNISADLYDCVRYPKTYFNNGEWDGYDYPSTKKEDWCGEWKEQQECDCVEITGDMDYNKYKTAKTGCSQCNGTGKIRR